MSWPQTETRGARADIRPGYLKCRSGAHIIYFRDLGDTLEIVRILRGAQDVSRHL
ncbi:MAG: type II toxin-antitoxin system RelE/ParE family toxin [Paracoccus aminovorans]|nr:type II toxin-antitoxin system RelE/ParE family toxin [Paracoccus aminovorans]